MEDKNINTPEVNNPNVSTQALPESDVIPSGETDTNFSALTFVLLTRMLPVLGSDLDNNTKFHVLMSLWFSLVVLKDDAKDKRELLDIMDIAARKLGLLLKSFVEHWQKWDEENEPVKKRLEKLKAARELLKEYFDVNTEEEPKPEASNEPEEAKTEEAPE